MVLVTACAIHAQSGCVARAARLLSGKGDETVLESDIPAPPGLESRHATGIEQRGETLVGGRFTYRGHVGETDAYADEIVALFSERGWTLWRRQVGPGHGRILFRKGDRQVDVNYRANPVSPAMGSATVLVSVEAGSAVPQSADRGEGRGAS